MKESEAMWLLANIQPATANELAEFNDEPYSSVHNTLKRLEAHGFIHRRRRDIGGRGTYPYEYAIREMDDA